MGWNRGFIVSVLLLLATALGVAQQDKGNTTLSVFPYTSDPYGRAARTESGAVVSLRPITTHALIVTHAFVDYVNDAQVKRDTDKLVTRLKDKGFPVIYINYEDKPPAHFYPSDKRPTLAIVNDTGTHRLPIQSGEVTVAGGLFDWCQMRTVDSLVYTHFQSQSGPLTIHVPLQTTYAYFRNARFARDLSLAEIKRRLESEGSVLRILEAFPEETKHRFSLFERMVSLIYSPDFETRARYENELYGYARIKDSYPLFRSVAGDRKETKWPRENAKISVYLDGVRRYDMGKGTQEIHLKLWSDIDDFAGTLLPVRPGEYLSPAG